MTRKGGIGRLRIRVAFDCPTANPDGRGGIERGWEEKFERPAEFIYSRGSEAVDAARLQGRSIYKIKVRQSEATRSITTAWRMRDVRREIEYNLREVDARSSRNWVYLVAESGVAV